METRITIHLEPMGAVRMTARGKWTSEKAQRYLTWKESVGYLLMGKRHIPKKTAVSVKATFHMQIPESWSKKKQQEHIGKPVTVKPDIDNLVKALFDAANGILWNDDNQVVRCEAMKVYSLTPKIEIEYEEVS